MWRKIFAHEAFVIRRLYRQLQDTYQGPKDYHEKGMRRNVVWNTCIYRNWVSSLEHFAARFWELPLSFYSFITNISPESFIASSSMGRCNLHFLLLLWKFLQSISCLIVEFSYNTLHKSKENVSKKKLCTLQYAFKTSYKILHSRNPLRFVSLWCFSSVFIRSHCKGFFYKELGQRPFQDILHYIYIYLKP